jgi:NAD(P)-dependent dehydrogenase (short-subunit alcohol dehydrogenase family)
VTTAERGSGTDLSGRVAVVTGAGRGVFRAVALQMARAGAAVVVVDTGGTVGGGGSNADVAEETAAEIRAAGGSALACSESVRTREGAAAIVASALDTFGRLDVVVNGAGIIRQNMIWDMPDEDFEAVLDTHLLGTWNCIRAALPTMLEQQSGSIVNCSSGVGVSGKLASSNYAAAKAGILGLTLAAALDLGPMGIRINAICPVGYSRMMDEEQAWRSTYPAEPSAPLPPDRFPVEAVAPLVVYLATDDAADVNGQILDCGGGSIGWYPPWRPERRIQADQGLLFTLDELARRVPGELLHGVDNCAPRQEGPDRFWPLYRR